MAKGLLITVPDIIVTYIDILNRAEKECIICTPYYKTIPELEETILNVARRGVKIWVFVRSGEEELFKPLENNPSILLTGIDGLHGKAILNEKEMVVSSLNFTESSLGNLEFAFHTDDENEIRKMKMILRRECGYGLDMDNTPLNLENPFMSCKCGITLPNTPSKDPLKKLCSNCYREAMGLEKISFAKYAKCKKCNVTIINNPLKPYCLDCYKQLSTDEKYALQSAVCKSCGKRIKNNPYKPYCFDCYSKLKEKQNSSGKLGPIF